MTDWLTEMRNKQYNNHKVMDTCVDWYPDVNKKVYFQWNAMKLDIRSAERGYLPHCSTTVRSQSNSQQCSQGLCPWTPLGAKPPDPHFLALRARSHFRPLHGHVFTNPPYSPAAPKSVKIPAIHSNPTTLTLTLNPKLKITPFLTLTLNRRYYRL